MLEKSGTITLTEEDLQKAAEGVVTERVGQTWGLTLQQLQELIEKQEYTTTTK